MERLRINNFKCFKEASLDINNLTLLVGANGCGKSSVIQSMLLMRNAIEHSLETRIGLNGTYGLALGTSSAVLNRNASGSEFSYSLEELSDGGAKLDFIFDTNTTDDQLWVTQKSFSRKDINPSTLDRKEFYYLNAERLGPRITQTLTQMDYLTTGINGEFTAQVIDWDSGRFKVATKRWFPESKSPYLPAQVNFWLNDILPGVKVSARTDTKTLSSRILIENYLTMSNPVLATNIGFGISYVLPIIVSGLVANEHCYLIVENPEAHLHPGAQSKIGQFLCMVAQSGVKVIVETHSDHVLNGIQIYVAGHPDYADKVSVNYFTVKEEDNDVSIQSISIKPNGELTHWPKGFFDQSQLDYMSLLKIRKNV